MTDLERAAETAYARGFRNGRREGYEEANKQTDTVIQGFAHRWMETGAADMRERAAQVAREYEAPTTARAILDLPLTPEEPCILAVDERRIEGVR